jgi:hypothetical protein
MHERETPQHAASDPGDDRGDHWAMYAEAVDLTIEGHRLIAEEIIFETKLLGRALLNRMRLLSGFTLRRGSTPPA